MKASNYDAILFEDYLRENRLLNENTIYVYVGSVEMFLKNNPDIDVLDDYNKFLIDLTIKKRCSHFFSAIRAFIDYKITDEKTKKKLLDGLVRPRIRFDIKQERKYLNEDKLFDVINNLNTYKHRILALIQCLTGVRVGDILSLKRGGIALEEYEKKEVLRLNILGKREKRNVVYIHDDVAKQLILHYINNYVTNNDYYFLEDIKSYRSNRLTGVKGLIRTNYFRYWEDLKKALHTTNVDKYDFATHDFRRCFARRVWEKFKDIHILQGMLNHADPKVTMKYLDQSGLKNIEYHHQMQT